MKKTLRTLIAGIGLAALASMAMAQEKVTYLFPAPDFLPAFAPFKLAMAKGYYKDAGLDVTFQVGKGGADVAKQVGVGNVDLGGGIGDTAIIVRANGIPVKGVAVLGSESLTQINWRTDAGISSVADLKGKSVGVLSFQDTTYYNLLAVLASAGLTKNDVDIQAVGPGGIIKLMITGDIQAFSGVPEWAGAIRGAGVDLHMLPINDIFPAMAQAIIASDDMIANNPDMVRAFVQATIRGYKDVIADPEQAAKDYVAAVPQHEGKEKIMEGIMRAYISLVYGADVDNFGSFDEARLKAVQEFYVSHEIVREAVPIADTYTNAFVK
ncbi:MAG: NitT/TauT family transport system substrate-binding protein [Paracoccaceae bacterium]|jgi:NitT/TauT family transport system substrate-binding protein